jgi:hypothetical protein
MVNGYIIMAMMSLQAMVRRVKELKSTGRTLERTVSKTFNKISHQLKSIEGRESQNGVRAEYKPLRFKKAFKPEQLTISVAAVTRPRTQLKDEVTAAEGTGYAGTRHVLAWYKNLERVERGRQPRR